MRRNGITTLSTSAWVSMPNGPSTRVEHTISGPFANRSGARASSRPRVTFSLEFGLTTRIRRGDAVIGSSLTGLLSLSRCANRIARDYEFDSIRLTQQNPAGAHKAITREPIRLECTGHSAR